MKKTLMIILIVVLAIALLIGILIALSAYLSGDLHEEAKALRKNSLVKYRYSRSGDMRGSRYAEEITPYDEDHALLRITSSPDWQEENQSEKTYLLDKEVLPEIERVFRKYRMNRWSHRRISRVFIADGASHSYSFSFGETSMRFSSQHYPASYAGKLQEIKDIVARYSREKIEIDLQNTP